MNYLRPDQDVLRAIFLYVGQGESTLLLVPNGTGIHTSVLVDCNRAPKLGGIDLARLLRLLPEKHGKPHLDLFVNTHPHNDHLCGIGDIGKAVEIQELWHSGHKPSCLHEGPYGEFLDLIHSLEKRGRPVERLLGTREVRPFGNATINVVSPAAYVVEDIAGESPEGRDCRIHEHCAVLRICYGNGAMRGILLTGDSDKAAWRDHITKYHGAPETNRVSSSILSSSHHGSRTFFKDDEDDEDVYTEHLEAIGPTHILVSSPDRKDSPHDHPHEDAMRLYEAYAGKGFVHHMGSRRWSFIVDVWPDGRFQIYSDHADLAEEFGLEASEDGGKNGRTQKVSPVLIIPRVESSRPMGLHV